MKVLIFSFGIFVLFGIIGARPKDQDQDQLNNPARTNPSLLSFILDNYNYYKNFKNAQMKATPKISQIECPGTCLPNTAHGSYTLCHALPTDVECPSNMTCCVGHVFTIGILENDYLQESEKVVDPFTIMLNFVSTFILGPKQKDIESTTIAVQGEQDAQDKSTAITPTETTTLTNLTTEPTQIAETTIKSGTNEEDGSCPGFCVDDAISSVCAQITDGLCKTGTTCCIQRDSHHYKTQ